MTYDSNMDPGAWNWLVPNMLRNPQLGDSTLTSSTAKQGL